MPWFANRAKADRGASLITPDPDPTGANQADVAATKQRVPSYRWQFWVSRV